MKIIDYIDADVPIYALPYLVNGDSSGMEESDIAACDEWYDDACETLRAKYPDADLVFLTNDDEGAENEFDRYPAFGLATSTLPCAIAVWVDNEDSRPSILLPWESEPIAPDEPGAVEDAIREILSSYPEGTLFDCIAHELWADGDGGWSVNDSWRMESAADLETAIQAIAARWEVWQLNYAPDARAADLEDVNCSGPEFGALLEVNCIPFMEIRPVESEG